MTRADEGWELTKSKYEEYILNSPEWQKKRMERLIIDEFRCQQCGAEQSRLNPLQVHHLDYHHLYHENPDKDLVTLCKCCHIRVHRMMNRVTNSKTGQRGWKDTLSVSEVSYERNMGKEA